MLAGTSSRSRVSSAAEPRTLGVQRLPRGHARPLRRVGPVQCSGVGAAQQTVERVEVRPVEVSQLSPARASPPQPSALPEVAQLSPETFNDFLRDSGDKLVLIDFYTDWCGPCQLMHKEIVTLTKAFPRGVAFAKFNCGLHPEFSTSQRIRSLPTFKLFQRGRLLEQVTGAKPVQLRQLLVHYYRGR